MKILTSEQGKKLVKDEGFELVYNHYEKYWFLWDDETTENIDLGKSLFPIPDKLLKDYVRDFREQVQRTKSHQEAA